MKKFSRRYPSPTLNDLLAQAREAMSEAIAPYSNFRVGAALLTKNGAIYRGHNIEVASYSLTMCAERVALFKALSEGEREFESILIVASSGDFCAPCGACRQVLMEFAPSLVAHLVDKDGRFKSFSISELLPESFSKRNLDHLFRNANAKTSRKARQSKGAHGKN